MYGPGGVLAEDASLDEEVAVVVKDRPCTWCRVLQCWMRVCACVARTGTYDVIGRTGAAYACCLHVCCLRAQSVVPGCAGWMRRTSVRSHTVWPTCAVGMVRGGSTPWLTGPYLWRLDGPPRTGSTDAAAPDQGPRRRGGRGGGPDAPPNMAEFSSKTELAMIMVPPSRFTTCRRTRTAGRELSVVHDSVAQCA